MRIWTVANQKGGVGKTTTAVSLGGWMALRGEKVLLVDLDPHASLTAYFGLLDAGHQGVAGLFAEPPVAAANLVVPTGIANLDLMPASAALATLERASATHPGWGRVIGDALAGLTGYDLAVLDCPPTLGLLMVNALAAADRLVVPTQTEYLALQGLTQMLRTARMVSRSRARRLPTLVLPTIYDKRTKAGQTSLNALMSLPDSDPDADTVVADEPIPVDTHFRDAAAQHIPLPQLDPDSRGAVAYRRVLDRVLLQLPSSPEAYRAAA